VCVRNGLAFFEIKLRCTVFIACALTQEFKIYDQVNESVEVVMCVYSCVKHQHRAVPAEEATVLGVGNAHDELHSQKAQGENITEVRISPVPKCNLPELQPRLHPHPIPPKHRSQF